MYSTYCFSEVCVCVLCVVWSGSGLNLAGWLVRERQEEIDYYRTYISTYRIHWTGSLGRETDGERARPNTCI